MQKLSLRSDASRSWRSAVCAMLLTTVLVLGVSCRNGEVSVSQPAPRQTQAAKPDYTTLKIRGKVGWLAEATERLHGVKSTPEAAERVIVLETEQGTLYPIVEDLRGSSFRSDQRLRGIPLELLVRRYDGSPMVQVIQVISIEQDGRYELDYWCDICAIAMYELKPCDCCQGEIQLRRRRLQPDDKNPEKEHKEK